MSPKRGERVTPPASAHEWEVRFGTGDAAKGWDELCRQAPGTTRGAWLEMRSNPAPSLATPRHHQLKSQLVFGQYGGRSMPCWQIEVTGGGRIWYLLDTEKRTVWVTFASTAHPKATE
ncbi:MAG: hypothetical protein ACR2FQ_00965 [Pseudonocardiaceae bacterium]